MNRKMYLVLALAILLTCFSAGARAEEAVPGHNNVVNEGQKVKNVFLYGENGIISGEVTDEVVVINGDLTLTGTARIKDRVFLLGGKLTQEPGAVVGEGIYQINLSSENLNSLLLGVGAYSLIELVKLFLGVLIFLTSLASLYALKNRVNRAKYFLQTNIIKTGLLGLFATIGLSLVFIALTVTIIGIPVAILMGLALLILLPVGLGALGITLGELLLKSFSWGEKQFYQVLFGSLFIVTLLNFPVLGVLWGAVILIIAVGALASSFISRGADSGE
ncbi:MAG: hypothetical protein ACOY31_10375 [Bacillota bacterium]